MKQVTVTINDDSKFHLLIDFLNEIPFVEVADDPSPSDENKIMTHLPKSILSPVKAPNFKIYGRDELHARQSFY